ncbi:WD40-repeat-containing domain protein [Mycena vulgaris]|nr:WD40-repeat-containing domain protein [Mycena vulgaris]KAJ6579599.1 WD40-repeat-containing domain protein [Mycena vulgaris]
MGGGGDGVAAGTAGGGGGWGESIVENEDDTFPGVHAVYRACRAEWLWHCTLCAAAPAMPNPPPPPLPNPPLGRAAAGRAGGYGRGRVRAGRPTGACGGGSVRGARGGDGAARAGRHGRAWVAARADALGGARRSPRGGGGDGGGAPQRDYTGIATVRFVKSADRRRRRSLNVESADAFEIEEDAGAYTNNAVNSGAYARAGYTNTTTTADEGRVLDGAWVTPTDVYYGIRVSGLDGPDDPVAVRHPVPWTISPPSSPSLDVPTAAEQVHPGAHAHMRQMRSVLLPAFRNVEKKDPTRNNINLDLCPTVVVGSSDLCLFTSWMSNQFAAHYHFGPLNVSLLHFNNAENPGALAPLPVFSPHARVRFPSLLLEHNTSTADPSHHLGFGPPSLHDLMLPNFPLCLEWLDFPPTAAGSSSDAATTSFGNYIAVGTLDPEIEIWFVDVLESMYPASILGRPNETKAHIPTPLGTGKKKRKKTKHRSAATGHHVDVVLALSWNKMQRNLLASDSADRTVKLWDLSRDPSADGGGVIRSFDVHKDKVQAVRWNDRDPSVLLTGSYDHTVRTFDLRALDAGVGAVVSSDVEAMRWDPWEEYGFYVSLENGLPSPARFTLAAHDGPASALDVNPHIRGCLATGGNDKLVKVWNVLDAADGARGVSLVTSRALYGKVFSTVFSPDDSLTLAAAGSKAKLQIWDVGANFGAHKAFGARLREAGRVLREKDLEGKDNKGGVVGVVDDDEESDGGED